MTKGHLGQWLERQLDVLLWLSHSNDFQEAVYRPPTSRSSNVYATESYARALLRKWWNVIVGSHDCNRNKNLEKFCAVDG